MAPIGLDTEERLPMSSVHRVRPPLPRFPFARFLHSAWCRAIARVLIVALVMTDMPAFLGPVAEAAPAIRLVNATDDMHDHAGPPGRVVPIIRFVNATDHTCQGQSPCYATIQQAINAANPGDTIRIHAGTYPEQLSIKNKNKQAANETARIVIEADPGAPVGSVVVNGATKKCAEAVLIQNSRFITVRGLTITGAKGAGLVVEGGDEQNHAIHLERNRIVGNGTAQCQEADGVVVTHSTPKLLISNNLIYGNYHNGVTFQHDVKEELHVVVNNTIWGNGWNGIAVEKEHRHSPLLFLNNLIGQNGRLSGAKGGRVGLWVAARSLEDKSDDDGKDDDEDCKGEKKGRCAGPENVQLLHNLLCGNRLGEVRGPVLDATDAGNLTPTGTEGPGVVASPGCAQTVTLFSNVDGPDGQADTLDDDFTLALTSPALDAGIDPRALGLSIAAEIFEADYNGEAARPVDGDKDGNAVFDIGALERTGGQCRPGTVEACYTGPPGTQGVGICRPGTRSCQADGTFGACQGQITPTTEVCNGLDDNCNGQIDEAFGQSTCGIGACQRTVDICANGRIQACVPGTPTPEICGDGIDQDCNGADLACPVNHAPQIISTPVLTATVGRLYSYNVNATDQDNDPLTYTLTTSPTGMTINTTTGVIQWTPASAQTGAQSVTVQVSDGKGGTAGQSFTIQVAAAVNHAPVAQDDQYVVRRQQTLTVAAPGVLQNDSDPDGNSLLAQLVAGPLKGVLNLTADGSFTYTPSQPPPGSNEPILKFGFIDPSHVVAYTVSQPIVVDLDKDGVPEIVFLAWNSFLQRRLIAVRGDTGAQVFSVDVYQPLANPPIVVEHPALAAGDLDGDGFPEIVMALTDVITGDQDRLIAFNRDGTEKWRSQSVIDHIKVDAVFGGTAGTLARPLIANILGDAKPEIVVGYVGKGPQTPAWMPGQDFVTVFDNQGRIVWTAQGGGSTAGGISLGNVIAQDINLDGNLEILFSDDVFDNQGHLLWSVTDEYGNPFSGIMDVAVANLDADPFGEIVYLTAYGQLYLYDHTGVRKWGPVAALPLSDVGDIGLLTIGDVDGDGTPEIVVIGVNSMAVVKGDGTLRTITLPYPAIGGNAAIFDLNGDGKPEIIYDSWSGPSGVQVGDLIILDGQTGAFLYSIKSPRYSDFTIGPVVADVDGDGTAEIITHVSNSGDGTLLHVFKAKTGAWAQARPVYNQSSYHVTNVNNDGTIPEREAINWLTPGLNNYRINVPLPQERTGDKDQFTYKANDGALDSNTATARIDILPPNTAPSILSQPPTVASPNVQYLYAVRAVDPDVGQVLIFSLPQAPTGMTIDSATGLIRWTPTPGQFGRHLAAVKVTDPQGEFAFQGFTIAVGSPVTVPNVVGQAQAAAQTAITAAGLTVGTITNAPSNTVPAGKVISQEPAAGATAPSGSAVNLVISSGPQEASVPNVVGQTQAAAQTAITVAGLTVGTVVTAPSNTVPAGAVISQDPAGGTVVPLGTPVNLVVSFGAISLNDLASVVVEPATRLILVGQQQAFVATGVFNDGTSQNLTGIVGWSSSAGTVASITPLGVATGSADGATNIQASVNSITGSATLTVRARVADSTPPTAAITAPANDTEVTSPVDITGTATDASFLKYVLEYAPAGETTFTLLTEGTAPVTNGVLGTFDPTLLINDQYTLRLTVFDRGGNTTQASVTVQVAREKKVGLFSITFQDLNIAVSGLPITINRTYDSRDKGKGDFGIGWRLDVQTLRIRTNRILGTGWVRGQSGATITLFPTDAHKVSVTLPDGKVEEFDMRVSPTSGLGSLDFTAVTGFIPRPGTLGALEALTNNSLAILNAGLEDELVDDTTLNTYNPQRFRYTTAGGQQIVIHKTNGVESVTDLNGNTLTFGPNGIIHSAGKSVTFTRDALGRIIQITDPAGNAHQYAYNANGDLISHTDPVGNTSRYTYNRSHGLLDIQDPAGNHAARNEYDAQGRLIATVDAQGNRIEFTHNLGASQEVVRDRLGNLTVFQYDSVGNVVAKTNALGNLTAYTYDSQGNQLTETDPLGRVAGKTYDAARNVLTSTDFDGNTTTNTYNARKQVLTTTDPEGRTTTNVYDASGNLTQTTDPEGGVTHHTYDVGGNRLTTTDPLGNVTTFAYDAFGHKTSETDPLGNVTTFSNDANGNVLSATKAGTQTTQFQYDAAQRLTKMIDALGHQTVTTYSTLGDGQKPASTTDAKGQVTRFDYDARGNLIGKTFPDGSTETISYDAENHILGKTDRDGHTTSFQYDALGRQTKITNPDGTSSTKTYDVAGRVLTQTNERGNTTTYAYAPNKQTVTDALGNVTVHEFDSRQRRLRTTDALAHVTTFAYDSAGNLVRTTFPDGTTKTTVYDAAKRKVTETDQAGHAMQFTYDARGRLVRVTDAAGDVSTSTYDALGNRVTQTDANGHLTSMEYDVLGRLTKRIRPLGQFETFAYDANGNQTAHVDFNGQTTTFAYDTNNRQISKTLPGGTLVSFAYTPSGLRTQAGGDAYVYDARGRLIRETKASGDILTYTYDAAGNKTSMTTPQGTNTYTYDALNRLATAVDTTGATTYSYDAVGNLASTAYPNGVTTTNIYNTLNRLIQMTNTGPVGLISSYTYTLGPAGNRLQVVEAGAATTGRTVAYAYDTVYRLTQETIDEPGTVNDQTIAYSYDAVGNRTQMNRNGVITTYAYDTNDRLLTETSSAGTLTSTYDNNGNLKTHGNGTSTDAYTYDAENRLVSADVQTGANPGLVSYTYDADGMRTSKTAGGVATTFLLDKNRSYAQVVVETTGATIVTYAYGNQLISQTRPGTGTHFYLSDGQLSTRQLTDTTGAVTDTYTYDAFGVLLGFTGTTPNVYLYVGEQLDPNVGFYYLRARYYNQATGRFITTDPKEGSIFDPASLHRYLYANADPIDNGDPSGQFFTAGDQSSANTIWASLLRLSKPALYGALASVDATFVFSVVGGQTPSLQRLAVAAAFGAVFGVAGEILGPTYAITTQWISTTVTGLVATVNSLTLIHKSRDVYWVDVENGLALNLGAGDQYIGATTFGVLQQIGTPKGELFLMRLVFSVLSGISVALFEKVLPKDNYRHWDTELFWYKDDKCPAFLPKLAFCSP